MKKSYLRTGEMAKILGINKKTLLYYAEQGLFEPEAVGENGYHYYSHTQAYTFYIIRSLRDAGLSIREIKEYLKTRQPARFAEVLAGYEKNLAQELRRLVRLRRIVRTKQELMKLAESVPLGEIHWEELPKTRLLLSEDLHNLPKEKSDARCQRFVNYCFQNGLIDGYPIDGAMPREDIAAGRWENYQYIYIRSARKLPPGAPAWITEFIRPAGLYAVGYFRGKHPEFGGAYQKMTDFLAASGRKTEGVFYEEGIIDDVCTDKEDAYVVRLAIKAKQP